MKFLVDESISWRMARHLASRGLDAVHVDRVGLNGHADADVYSFALREGRIVITRDADFTSIWSTASSGRPPVILLRRNDSSAIDLAELICEHAPNLESDLHAGAFVIFEETAIRVQRHAGQ